MFEHLKRAFSDAARNISFHKEISEKDLDNQLSELELSLLESDVAPEVVDDLFERLRKELLGLELEKGQTAEEVVKLKLRNHIAEMFDKSGSMNLIDQIKSHKEVAKGPFVILLVGINGTGKTTTVAKMARLLKKNGISVVLAAADTHRAGAMEQLSQHGKNLSIKVISQRYGADPSAVGRDAFDYASKHHIDAVLIDTAGRMQTAKNLMDEINKIVRVVKPNVKLFIGDSLTGNDTINQAREFFQYTNFDGAILTKTDADVKGGSAISIVHVTSKPIVLLGVGQGYDDIIPFYSEKFLDSIFGELPLIGEEKTPLSKMIQQDISKENKQDSIIANIGVSSKKKPLRAMNEVNADELIQRSENKPTVSSADLYNVKSNSDDFLIRDKPAESTKLQQQELQQQQDMTGPSVKKIGGSGEKREPDSFFRGLFNRKNKNRTKDQEKKDHIQEYHSTDTSDKKFDEKHTEENREKKVKKQQQNDEKEEEVVHLSDEDIEDLLK